jgi:excisionase family DNA binding protein
MSAVEAAVKPPFTITEYASLHGISRTVVRKWIKQGRIPTERRGGGMARAGIVLILTAARPGRVTPGTLTEAQRSAWKKKRS